MKISAQIRSRIDMSNKFYPWELFIKNDIAREHSADVRNRETVGS